MIVFEDKEPLLNIKILSIYLVILIVVKTNSRELNQYRLSSLKLVLTTISTYVRV